MNIMKWAKQKANEKANEKTKIAKNKKARKQLDKNMPELAKRQDVTGVIARRKEQQRKLLEEMDK